MSTEPERLPLARLPTPIQKVPELAAGIRIRVKRDDLTGCALSGNKIRKLEYLLAEARHRGATRVITCGGVQSNHCRATAVAAAQLGLRSLLLLRTTSPPPEGEPPTGNLKLAQLVGAQVRFITPEHYGARNELMRSLAEPGDYVIPEGGSNGLGAWGYIRAFREMAAQWGGAPSSIVCATGSGGTVAGLTIAARAAGLDIPVYGICVAADAPTFQAACALIADEAHHRWPELPQLGAGDFRIVEGFVGRGYALSTEEEMADIARVARASGLLLDPVYTGKAFRALLHEPARFGPSPLFVHTGGIFGLLA